MRGWLSLVRAVVTTAGVISSAPSVVNQNFTGSADLVEMVGAPNGTEFTATPSSIVGTDGTPALPTNLKDMISIAPGVVVTASNTAAASEVTLTMRAGNDSAIATYTNPHKDRLMEDSQRRRSVHQFLNWESDLGSWGWRRRSR